MNTPVDPFVYAHQHRDEIVWMSQNTNHIPTDPRIEEAIVEAVKNREYNYYPYAGGIFGLSEALARDVEAPEGHRTLVTNGAIEALYILTRALLHEGDEVICTNPSFMPIHHQIRLCGAKPVEIPIYRPPYKLTVEWVQEAITPRTTMFLLIDPHNPLGTEYTEDEVRAFCEIAEDHSLIMVHDVTYRDFAFHHTPAHRYLPDRTLTVYSFSKNAGLAGMRIGGLIGPGHLMERIEPYNTNVLSANVLAQRAALAALETKSEWMGRVVEQARKNQEIIKKAVEGAGDFSLPVYPSSSNMFVMDLGETGIDPDVFQNTMLFDHGVFVRSGKYVSREFGHRFVRISFTVPQEGAEKFAMALPKVKEKLLAGIK